MATDYDAPRKSADDETDSLDAIKDRVPNKTSSAIDVDDVDGIGFELAGDNITDMELDVVVLPQQDDEFTCVNCFIVRHQSQLQEQSDDGSICAECAS